jgi:transcriptional regulator with XRE-family HTH domain
MLNTTTKTRLHIHSIEEVKPPQDADLAELFSEMREATGLSLDETAAKLNTSVATVKALEHGEIEILPSWDEVNRVVVDYTNLLGLDSDPVLRRIMLQLPRGHQNRPRTRMHTPSYDNMQSNAKAIMNRVPASQTPTESSAVSVDGQRGNPRTAQATIALSQIHKTSGLSARLQAATVEATPNFTPNYGEMRAIPPGSERSASGTRSMQVAKKRTNSVFVFFMQLLVLLAILGSGYVIWLAMNDPQGYEDLKSLFGTGAKMLADKVFSPLSMM